MREFEQTPSANLTLDQFNTIDIEHEADPPVYSRNKLLEARVQAIRDNNVELLTSGALDDPQQGKKASRWREEPKFSIREKQLSNLYDSLETELKHGADASATSDEQGRNYVSMSQQDANVESSQLTVHQMSSTIPYPKKNGGTLIVLPDDATPEELQRPTQPSADKFSLSLWKEDMPEIAMEEIDMLFRDDDEMKQKEVVFDRVNKEFLEQQKRKQDAKAANEAIARELQDDDAAQAEGKANYASQRAKKRKLTGKAGQDGESYYPTTEQALLAAVSTRKISRKINYDAMSSIFDEDGSFATDLLDDRDGTAPRASYEVELDHF